MNKKFFRSSFPSPVAFDVVGHRGNGGDPIVGIVY